MGFGGKSIIAIICHYVITSNTFPDLPDFRLRHGIYNLRRMKFCIFVIEIFKEYQLELKCEIVLQKIELHYLLKNYLALFSYKQY